MPKTSSKDCYEIILNHSCDLACGFCSQSDFTPGARTSLKDALRHIHAARKAGYRRLGFSGGEALLRADLPALAAAADRAGFRAVRLQTNGMKLSDPALARKLAGSGLTVCKFTFLGRSAPVHDGLTGSPGSFKKSLAGLDNILALKLAVGVNLLITRRNYRQLKSILRFFMDRGVSSFVLIYPIYVGRMAVNSGKLGVSLPEASPYAAAALDLAKAAGLGCGVKALNMPPCMLPGHERRSVDIYKFNTMVASPLGKRWDLDTNLARERRRGPVCRGCLFRKECLGVDARYLDIFGWAGFKPVLKLAAPRELEPAPGYLSGLEQCFMEVLARENAIPTARVLALARRIPLCHDCKDGARVLSTGESLVKRGLVERSFRNAKFFWRLK